MKWAAKWTGIAAVAGVVIAGIAGIDPEKAGGLVVSVGTVVFLLLWTYDGSARRPRR